jgi:hypothetical protein
MKISFNITFKQVYTSILLLFVFFIIYSFTKQTPIKKIKKNKNKTINENMLLHKAQPTKCFDCEDQIKYPKKYMGGPTKCFDCEKQLEKNYGAHTGNFGHATKCFDCENQYGTNPIPN